MAVVRERTGRTSGFNTASFFGHSLLSMAGVDTGGDLREEDVWGSGYKDAGELDTSDRFDDAGDEVEGPALKRYGHRETPAMTSAVDRQGEVQPLGAEGSLKDGNSHSPSTHGPSGGEPQLVGKGYGTLSAVQIGGKVDKHSTPSRIIPQVGQSLHRANGVHQLSRRQSAPVNVPDWTKIASERSKRSTNVEDADGDDDGESIPPHELLAREYSKAVTKSVYEGVGRTLRGRDLRVVRNAVLEQTGFFDA